MFLIISEQFVAISPTNTDNICLELCLYSLKDYIKTEISLDLCQMETNEDKPQNEIKSSQKSNYSIICGNFSLKSKYLAICDNRKQLIVFENIANNWKQIFKTKVARNCIKLLFSLNKNTVICGHKSGDVFEYELDGCGEQSSVGRLLFGHCSMLLDLIQTNDSKYLISADRDEKIRVSNYPNSYHIQSYGLGHKEFVSTIDMINNETIISGSGDGSVRLWNVFDGKQIDVFMCDSNETIDTNSKTGTHFSVKKLVTNCKTKANWVSVSFYRQTIVKIYSIESMSIKLIHTLSLDEEPIDIQFDVSDSDVLWVLLPKSQNPLNLYKISSESISKTNIYENVVKELNSNESFLNNCLNEKKNDELSGLYKHWFNNVETYLQNKQKRQQVMNKKKKFFHF